MSKAKTKTPAPKSPLSGKSIDVDEEANRLLEEIEEQFPPSRCSLDTYRALLRSLQYDINQRILLLNSEIGNSDA